ncbi:MAG TPA: hypothetical protein VFW98_10790 [Gemmatimonadaceae bacterium]|nr:hypothetical protein [Gemmatimonadaceae bacterium]
MPASHRSLAQDLPAALAHGLDAPPSTDTARLARGIAAAFGDATLALLHYGSHAHRSDARPESAHDFFVIVRSYRAAYRALAASLHTGYSPTTATMLAHLLPPNVIAVRPPDAAPLTAKCAVLSLAHLRRACSPRARDHFVHGRLFQQIQLAWVRDEDVRAVVTDAVLAVRAHTLAWGRPYLPAHFTVHDYCRTLLETSFAAEIRPEGNARLAVLLEAQRGTLTPVYETMLQYLVLQRILASDGKVYSIRQTVDWLTRARIGLYFRRSKLRATLRWLKYIALYDDWLDYLLRKIERRSGMSIALTPRERRWPLLFLWPKVIRYLRTRPQHHA